MMLSLLNRTRRRHAWAGTLCRPLPGCFRLRRLRTLNAPAGLNWTEPIHVVASSPTTRPAQLEPLDLDAYRLSFWWAAMRAVGIGGPEDEALLQHLRAAAASMRVTFVLCRSTEEVLRRKWNLTSKLGTLSETMVLRGWKRVAGVVQVKTQLQEWNLQSSDEAVPWACG